MIDGSAPVWMDWLLAATMWVAGGLLAYAGLARLNHGPGAFLMMLRMVALGWLLYAGRLTWVLVERGDLVLTWWATAPLMLMAAGTVGIGIERVGLWGPQKRRR